MSREEFSYHGSKSPRWNHSNLMPAYLPNSTNPFQNQEFCEYLAYNLKKCANLYIKQSLINKQGGKIVKNN